MVDQYYFGASHARLGPYSAMQMKELKELGRLQATDMVWKEGIEKGTLAANLRGLFGAVPVTEAVVAPTLMPTASEELEEEIVPESLELRSIPDDRVYAQRAAKARLAAQTRYGTHEPGAASATAAMDAKNAEHVDLKSVQDGIPRTDATPVKKRRATALSGAIIVSQDGERVRFRKKCIRCGFEESTKNVMRIQTGINRQMFSCSKCKKQVELSIRGI